jgi:hypothetical protein
VLLLLVVVVVVVVVAVVDDDEEDDDGDMMLNLYHQLTTRTKTLTLGSTVPPAHSSSSLRLQAEYGRLHLALETSPGGEDRGLGSPGFCCNNDSGVGERNPIVL